MTASEDVLLRPGVAEDLAGVQEVLRAATSAAGIPPEHRTPEQVRVWADGLLEPGSELWVAVGQDELLGFLTLRGAWLPQLFVHPERPAAGVGAALLDLAKGLRPQGFGLRVHQANERARAFYRKHGLVELESTSGSAYDDEAPDLRMAWLGDDPLGYLRRCIDEVDDELALLLARRAALTAAVQDRKDVGGHAGRDRRREAEIVQRMHAHVPDLDRELLTTVMHTIIAESLAAWERRPPAG